MCSALKTDCGYDNSSIIFIGDVYCPNAKCLGKFCLHKTTFQSLGRSDYQCPQGASLCQVRNILLKNKKTPFSCRFVKEFTFLKRDQSQFQKLLELSIVLESFVSTEKCESFDGYVTTPRSISGCGKCGAWLFVHKVPFKLQEHVKTTKTDKTRFFFARKR